MHRRSVPRCRSAAWPEVGARRVRHEKRPLVPDASWSGVHRRRVGRHRMRESSSELHRRRRRLAQPGGRGRRRRRRHVPIAEPGTSTRHHVLVRWRRRNRCEPGRRGLRDGHRRGQAAACLPAVRPRRVGQHEAAEQVDRRRAGARGHLRPDADGRGHRRGGRPHRLLGQQRLDDGVGAVPGQQRRARSPS